MGNQELNLGRTRKWFTILGLEIWCPAGFYYNHNNFKHLVEQKISSTPEAQN